MTTYNFDEGVLELPGEWNDRTVNMYERPIEGVGALMMVVTRSEVPEATTAEADADEQLKILEPRLRRFELVSRAADKTVGVAGVRIRYRFFHPELGQACATQLNFRHDKKMVTVSMTAPFRLEAEMIAAFDAVLKTFKLRRRTA